MKLIWFVMALFRTTFSTTAVWAQDTEAATKSKIIALEQLWNQAYKSGDTKALDSILDDGIVLVNDDGSVQTKAEFLASVKSSAPDPGAQQQQVAPESFNVHVSGNVAIARRDESERRRRRQAVHEARTLCRYLGVQARGLGVHWHECYARFALIDVR
jgi:ketosteroid isomerase-like protein